MLNRADNAITPMRLGLALLVVFSHAFDIGGFGPDPLNRVTGGQMKVGTVAVIAFFGLSGFLLARSRETTSRAAFLRNRALRIVPGLWVCLAFVALVIVPIAVSLGGRADVNEVRDFVLDAARFGSPPRTITGLFPGTPAPDWVDGPLWTLQIEVGLYLALVALPLRLLRPVAHIMPIAAFLLNALFGGHLALLHLPVAFAIGVLLHVERARIPLTGPIAASVLAVTAVAAFVGSLAVVGPATLPFLALFAAARMPLRWSLDLSYGTYIYAGPIQQLLAMGGLAAMGFVPYLTACLVLILGVAFVSAKLVEEPALRLRTLSLPSGLRYRWSLASPVEPRS